MPEEQEQLLQQVLLHQVDTLLDAGDTAGLGKLLNEQRSSDIAEIVQIVNNEERRTIFDALEKPLSAEVLEKVDEATRSELFEILEDEELISIISHLDADDAADVLAEMDEDEVADILESMPAA